MAVPAPKTCGLLGPSRANDGLGPFLARFLEEAGVRVVAFAGRDLARTRAAAVAHAQTHGHDVQSCADPAELCAVPGLDALVIAAPNSTHLPALRLALAARLHVLCEKPLVLPEEHALVPPLARGFADARLVLQENCQWPHVLGAHAQLFPELDRARIASFAMRLSPSSRGRAMLVDALSHFLSVAQALIPSGAGVEVTDLRFSTGSGARIALAARFGGLSARLFLAHCAKQPRPAWLSLDGLRMAREIEPSHYAISFRAGERRVAAEDPQRTLVYGFAQSIRSPTIERIRDAADAIQQRARLYAQILAAWDAGSGP